MLLFGIFEFTRHCRCYIKFTLQFSLKIGIFSLRDQFFLSLPFALGITLVWVGLSVLLSGRVLQFIVAFFCIYTLLGELGYRALACSFQNQFNSSHKNHEQQFYSRFSLDYVIISSNSQISIMNILIGKLSNTRIINIYT
ncbi:Hypothetical_protein [Hexamita inflata]|uniref:Hypothetical_protein n=1 Tax=Hexamita inflata TaxID=28002 RepID=A0ABP1GZD2_9EUKA